mgnify:CR=1 FL=1
MTKELDKLLENYFSPSKLTKSLFYEYIESAIREEERTELTQQQEEEIRNLEDALDELLQHLKNNEYAYEIRDDNKIVVISDERQEVLKKLQQELKPFGYVFSQSGDSSIGRLQLTNLRRRGRKIGLYLYFKPKTPGVGRQSYDDGVGTEKIIAQNIINVFPDVRVEKGGNTRSSDIALYVEDTEKTKIEVKKSLRSDFFQQFKVKWTPNGWKIIKTRYHNPFNDRVFEKYIKPWMDENATFTEEEVRSDLFTKDEKGHILGIKYDKLGNEEHIKTRNKLNRWFGGKIDFFIDIDFKDLKRFYNRKGDDYLHINKYGLFGTSQRAASKIKVPNFQKQNIQPRARLRVKSHGANNTLTFTIVPKLTGSIAMSSVNLYKNENVIQIENLLK